METKIDWYNFSFWGDEKKYVNHALDSTWLSGGDYLDKFENSLANRLNLPNAFVVANGTAALNLVFLAIGIEPGDEVIVPAFGFLAAANVLKLMQAVPIFADIDKETWCVSSKSITGKISPRTKAIVVVHNYGVVSEIQAIKRLCESKNLFLIEDCAESIFSKFDNIYSGKFGDFSTYSFHATKTISTGEGGMVTCNNEVFIDKIKLIRSHGLRREKKHYWHEYFGHNFRLSNLLAAIGLAQLEKIEEIIDNKSRVLQHYRRLLSSSQYVSFQGIPYKCEPVIWAIAISLKNISADRDRIMDSLKNHGIDCRPGFYTPDQLEIYNKGTFFNNYPIANKISSSVIVLPSYPKLSNSNIEFISQTLIDILSKNA